MFRYVAFVWDDADPEARAKAGLLSHRLRTGSTGWGAALDRKGLQVFCAGTRPGSAEPYRLHDGAGVVLGKLFQRSAAGVSDSGPLALSDNESLEIVASRGRRLVDAYWGRYVAFIHDRAARVTGVLRDPTGALPCFTARFAGVDVYFSCMEDIAQLGSHSFSVNWKYVAATLCQAQLQIHATGLNEVSQVLGGECVEHRDGRTERAFLWNPLEIAQRDVIDDPLEAAAELRATTRDCVHAWASSFQSIVHMLSGGLDSSIILACLKDAPVQPKIVCLNYYAPGSNSDERDFARLSAEDAGFELIERERNAAVSLESLLRVSLSAIPGDYFFYLDESRYETQLAKERGARAIFSGYGGDQIFYRSRASLAAGDFLKSQGVGAALFEVALDAARMDRTSVWNVLRKAARDSLPGRRWSVNEERPVAAKTVIRSEVTRDISRATDLLHPLLRAPGRAPHGKIFHAHQVQAPLDYYNPLGSPGDPETIAPLFSQPLLELAMRIPTWLLVRGGWDRAMARRAFEHDIPRRIVIRRTKGGQEEHAKTILVRNLPFARSLLLDGHLVRERILEKDLLNEALSQGPARFASGNVELYGCLSAEAWLRQWTSA